MLPPKIWVETSFDIHRYVVEQYLSPANCHAGGCGFESRRSRHTFGWNSKDSKPCRSAIPSEKPPLSQVAPGKRPVTASEPLRNAGCDKVEARCGIGERNSEPQKRARARRKANGRRQASVGNKGLTLDCTPECILLERSKSNAHWRSWQKDRPQR